MTGDAVRFLMDVSTYAERIFAAPRQQVFDTCLDNDNAVRFFTAYGPIPGVVGCSLRDADALAVGVRRIITTSDGVTMDEEILAYESPVLQTYRWGGQLKPPLAWLVRTGTGHWTFDEIPEGTRVRWTYTFAMTTPLVWPVMWVLSQLFRRWMTRALDGLATA